MNDTDHRVLRKASRIKARLALLCEQFDQSLSVPVLRPDEVHKVRVILKKLRAWVRLQHSLDKRKRWKKLDRHLHALADQLNAARDVQVLHERLAWLMTCLPVELERTAQGGPVASRLPPVPEPEPDRILSARLAAMLAAAMPGFTKAHKLHKALRSSTRRAAHSFRKCIGQPPASTELHRFRRQVKQLSYQLDISLDETDMENRLRLAYCIRLGHQLGDLHDQVLLLNWLRENPANAQTLIDTCQKEIQHSCAVAMTTAKQVFPGVSTN